MENFSSSILKVVQQDFGNRGIKSLIDDEINKDLLDSCKEILNSKSVAIITGFFCRDTACETDGPLGAIVIAKALIALEKKVCMITDEKNKPIIEKAIEFSGFNIKLYVYPTGEESLELSEKIIKDQSLDHIISIERIGPGIDSHCYSMSGKDLTHHCGKTENLIKIAQKMNIKTTAIGDGGNELGMGKVYEKVKKFINHGEKIACSVAADYVIVVGVSNWGGLAISACLFKLSNEKDLFKFLYSVEDEVKLLDYIVKNGSIDGITGKQELSVDGFGYYDLHSKILEEIIKLVNSS